MREGQVLPCERLALFFYLGTCAYIWDRVLFCKSKTSSEQGPDEGQDSVAVARRTESQFFLPRSTCDEPAILDDRRA